MSLPDSSLTASYRYCEDVARRQAANFYPAFRLLPRPRRLAMCALYTFMRIADDLSDEPGETDTKRAGLKRWRAGIFDALAGRGWHPSHPALAHIITTYAIPTVYLEAVMDGVEMDLEPTAYETFADLRLYCYRVASAVGLACIHIWGFQGEEAKQHAEEAGLAFQLTNILRDLREDAERGRVYLPREDLARFGYDATGLAPGERNAAFQSLMRFEAERARGFYAAADALLPCLSAEGRAVFLLMARTYRGLLDEIERRDYDVFSARVKVPRWRKLLLALRVLPVRWGWV